MNACVYADAGYPRSGPRLTGVNAVLLNKAEDTLTVIPLCLRLYLPKGHMG